VLQDLDLEEENFIQDTEMLGYFNEAIRDAKTTIDSIYKDYFLTSYPLPVTTGTAKYTIPSTVGKIRGFEYNNNNLIYPIKQFRDWNKFLKRDLMVNANPDFWYRYLLLNPSPGVYQIELSPPAKETSSNFIIWHLRPVVELTGSDTDPIDLPEFVNFIYAFVKGKCKQKENGGIMPPDAQSEIDRERQLMVDNLTDRVPDYDNEVEKDLSIYYEHS